MLTIIIFKVNLDAVLAFFLAKIVGKG